MRITVKVKPNSPKQEIKIENGTYIVKLTSPPLDGRANRELIEILSEYFNIPKSHISLISGHKGRVKILDIKTEV